MHGTTERDIYRENGYRVNNSNILVQCELLKKYDK